MDKAATPPTLAEARRKRHQGGHKSARSELQRRCAKPITGGAPQPELRQVRAVIPTRLRKFIRSRCISILPRASTSAQAS